MAVSLIAGVMLVSTAPAVPPPVNAGQPAQRGLAVWMPGPVECDGGAIVAGEPIRRPLGAIVSYRGERQETVAFDIDASGRPISIVDQGRGFMPADDVAPALAVSRFPAQERKGCRVTYTMQVTPFETAELADLVSYSITQRSGRLPKEAWERISGQGDCAQDPRPQPLVRAYPDFGKVEATPGVRDWALIGYDTDTKGKPTNVHAVMGTGNEVLDKAAAKAVSESRFTEGARSQCVYPYWRTPAVLPAPAMPEKGTFPAGELCPKDSDWEKRPEIRFPAAYNRRKIEGWAIIGYDVAPWGGVGNLKVLAAQPSADFGKQALSLMGSAKRKVGTQGASNCVQAFRFAMEASEDKAEAD